MSVHLRRVPVILVLCACAQLAHATPFSYLQSPQSGGGGFGSTTSSFQSADNFSVVQKTKLTSVRWWGAYQNNPPSGADPFTVRFFAPDPMNGNAPQTSPTNQFTSLAITRTNSGLVNISGNPVYRYDAPLSTPVIFSAGSTNNYFSVLSGSSNQWFWQKSTNAGSNWFRASDAPENSWFLASDGNLAFELIGVTPSPGDYDTDFDVDTNDYSIWRHSFGNTGTSAADGNGNGKVDGADYVIWRKYVGTSAASGSSATAVPEPSSLLLTISAIIAGRFIRSRRLARRCY